MNKLPRDHTKLRSSAGEISKPQHQENVAITARMEEVMGHFPLADRQSELQEKVIECFERKGLRYEKIQFHPEPADRCLGWFIRRANAPVSPGPAMLCLHQTTPFGKDEPAGLGGNPSLNYAEELAARGWATFSPDYPGFGEYFTDPYKLGYLSATMKGIWNHHRCVDLLSTRPEVDSSRIGVIGHSLGGHNALFVAAFESRLQLVVSSCGFTRFTRNDNEGQGEEGDLTDWSHPGYMPLIASQYRARAENMPFDFPDVLRAIYPRPIFINAPSGDFMSLHGVRECLSEISPLYSATKTAGALVARHPCCGHDFPSEAKAEAYSFITQHL